MRIFRTFLPSRYHFRKNAMQTDHEYVVETFIEADVTSSDGTKECHASMGGVTGIDNERGQLSPRDAAKRSVSVFAKQGWLETFLRETARWDPQSINGATAQCQVRTRVARRSAEGRTPEGEFSFEDVAIAGMP
jgi:hypothetical protein